MRLWRHTGTWAFLYGQNDGFYAVHAFRYLRKDGSFNEDCDLPGQF